MDSSVKEAKERFEACWSAMNDNRVRMLEDLRFSNPAKPEQWDRNAERARGDRPMLVFDQTNQYIAQTVNDGRQNKPSMKVRPVDDNADVKTAKALNGLLYHIQDASRADIATDTALESAARVGLGWMRVVPEVTNAETNEQEIRIKRVHDFTSIVLDDQSTEPDGSDAMDGFVMTPMSAGAFKKAFKGAKVLSFDEGGWFRDDVVRVCEYFKVEEKTVSYLTVTDPTSGQQIDLEEDEYWKLSKAVGQGPLPYVKQWTDTQRSVKWTKLSGLEELESTDFPASHVPLIPVIGNELYIEGKRYLCGMVRKGMDAQRAYNYARSTEIELISLQPKVPMMVSAEAVEGYEDEWGDINASGAAYVRWNALDDDGKATIPKPERVQSAQFPAAFAQLSQMARDDLQAAFGMYKSNLGAPSNAVSGRAKMQDQREGDTANFHYIDNLSRSMRHMGSIVLEMIPKIYDTKRVARILGQDGTPSQVIIDPNAPQSYQRDPQGKVTINPSVGKYDVTASTGPAYATLRQEAAEQMAQLFQGNPQTFQILGDLYVKHQDWPYADEAAQRLKAMLPPQLQGMGDEAQDNPQLQQAMQQLQQAHQQLQQLQGVAQQMEAKLKEKDDTAKQSNANDHDRNKIAAYQAETQRLAALVPADPQLAAALYQQTLMAVMQMPTPMGAMPTALPPGVPPPQIPPPPPPPMQGQQPQQSNPPSAGFSLPAQNAPQGPFPQ